MANPLPIILLGVAAVAISSSKKKKGKKSSKMIDKGTYSYSSNCERLFIGGIDVTSKDNANKSKDDLSEEQRAALDRFGDETLAPAIVAEIESHSNDTDFDDRPMFLTELAAGVTSRLIPECSFKEGARPGKAAGAMIGIALSGIQAHIASTPGANIQELVEYLAFETLVMIKAYAEAKSHGKDYIDIVKLIREVRENPEKYGISESDIEEFNQSRNLPHPTIGSSLGMIG